VVGLSLIPYPFRITAPGSSKPEHYSTVVNATPGYAREVLTPPGTQVAAGQPLLRLEAPELDYDIAAVECQLARAEAVRRQALQEAGRQPRTDRPSHRRGPTADATTCKRRRADLTVRARQAGFWAAPAIEAGLGAWLPRGTVIGQIIDTRTFLFRAVVSQQGASRFYSDKIRNAGIRLRGQADRLLPVRRIQVLPAEQNVLPSRRWVGVRAATLRWT